MSSYPYGSGLPTMSQMSQLQSMFPQPQGSVYSINAPLEVGNVPIGSTGLSIALCLQENLMYIKSFQNGNPVIMAYKITPYTRGQNETNNAPTQSRPPDDSGQNGVLKAIEQINQRLAKLEIIVTAPQSNNSLDSGGKFDGLL